MVRDEHDFQWPKRFQRRLERAAILDIEAYYEQLDMSSAIYSYSRP